MDRNKVRKQAQVLRNKQLVREHRRKAAAKAKTQVKDKVVRTPRPQLRTLRKSTLPMPPPSPNKQKAIQVFANRPVTRKAGCAGCRRKIGR